MARPKKVEDSERQTVTITYKVVPFFAVSCDDPKLSGITGVGSTAKEALARMRAEVRRRYPLSGYDVVEKAENRDMFLATGWENPTYE